MKNSLCDIKVDRTLGGSGDKVLLQLTPNPGINVIGIDVTDNSGNPIPLGDDNSFLIADADVIISVRTKYILYNVDFISAGVVISHQELVYGAMPVLPPDPSIASDGSFEYTFVGWSPSVSAVSGNATYEAIFEKAPVTEQNTVSPDDPMANIMKYVKIALIAVVVILTGAVVLVIVLVIKKVRQKMGTKKKAMSDANASSDGESKKENTKSEDTVKKTKK